MCNTNANTTPTCKIKTESNTLNVFIWTITRHRLVGSSSPQVSSLSWLIRRCCWFYFEQEKSLLMFDVFFVKEKNNPFSMRIGSIRNKREQNNSWNTWNKSDTMESSRLEKHSSAIKSVQLPANEFLLICFLAILFCYLFFFHSLYSRQHWSSKS